MADSIHVLTPEQADQVAEKVIELRPEWRSRLGFVPFWTIGSPSYMDAKLDIAVYYDEVKRFDQILVDHFSWLNELVLEHLREFTGEQVQQSEKHGRPGFHIYESCECFRNGGDLHFDVQHYVLPWDDPIDMRRSMSFTLAISLPESGGGMWIWPELPEHLDRPGDLCVKDKVHSWSQMTPYEDHRYEVGKMAIHFNKRLHKIAPFKNPNDKTLRITLQGHGVWSETRGWLVYW